MTQTPSSTSPSTAAGSTRFALRAMERVVSAAIAEVPGTTQIDAKLAGLAGRAFPRLLVQMDPDTRMVAIDATIAVTWPAPVTDVAVAVRSSIREALAAHTGFSTTRVNVTVGGAVAGSSTTAEQLAAHSNRAATTPEVALPAALRAITVESRGPVRSVEVPRPASVKGVAQPQPATVRHVSAPEPMLLRGISTPAPVEVHHPQPSRPQPLRAISITPYVERSQP